MAKLHWSFGPATIPLHSNCDGGIVFCCVFKFKAFVARVFEVVFEGDEITGQLPLASGFEPSGHGTGAVLLPPPVLPPPLLLLPPPVLPLLEE
jgi:hypothetical protein